MHTYVAQEKIDLIHAMLADPTVNELYFQFLNLPRPEDVNTRRHEDAAVKRNAAFKKYAYARDNFLGLPHLDQLPSLEISHHGRADTR